jgi:hypothetical protein
MARGKRLNQKLEDWCPAYMKESGGGEDHPRSRLGPLLVAGRPYLVRGKPIKLLWTGIEISHTYCGGAIVPSSAGVKSARLSEPPPPRISPNGPIPFANVSGRLEDSSQCVHILQQISSCIHLRERLFLSIES